MPNIRNGHQIPYLSRSVTVKKHSKKKNVNVVFFILFAQQFVLMFGGFIGILYYMDGRLKSNNEHIDKELKNQNKLINEQIQFLDITIKNLKKYLNKPSFENGQLHESESHKFRSVVLDSVDAYPEIENINEEELPEDSTEDGEELEEEMEKESNIKNFFNNHDSSLRNLTDNDLEHQPTSEIHIQNNSTPIISPKRLKRGANQRETELSSQNSFLGKYEKTPIRLSHPSEDNELNGLRNYYEDSTTNKALGIAQSCAGGNKAVAAHFEADISQFPKARNNYVAHPTKDYLSWKPSAWFSTCKMLSYFRNEKKTPVQILQDGLYYVYAQIFYSNEYIENGYQILKKKESQPVFVCSATKSSTCYTGGILYLKKNDELYITDFYSQRNISWIAHKSFFGLFKIGP